MIINLQGAYDLRVVDSGPVGTRHHGIPCNGSCEPSSSSSDIVGIRWTCAHCPSFNLCSKCYMADEHDTTHKFRRVDSGAEEDPGQVCHHIRLAVALQPQRPYQYILNINYNVLLIG